MNEAEEQEMEALLVEAADETQNENDIEALLLEAADETQNEQVRSLLTPSSSR